MAKVIVKQGLLSVEGKLYRKGDEVDVANAEELVQRAAGRIVLAGAASETPPLHPPAGKKKPQPEPAREHEEEAAALPDADPVASVKK